MVISNNVNMFFENQRFDYVLVIITNADSEIYRESELINYY